MDFVVVLAVLLLIVVLVSAPLRRGRVAATEASETAERAELEAARDAKYREIRDAELDHRTGKLSDADWRVLDRTLRAEAVGILRRLDELPGGGADRPAEWIDLPGEGRRGLPGEDTDA